MNFTRRKGDGGIVVDVEDSSCSLLGRRNEGCDSRPDPQVCSGLEPVELNIRDHERSIEQKCVQDAQPRIRAVGDRIVLCGRQSNSIFLKARWHHSTSFT